MTIATVECIRCRKPARLKLVSQDFNRGITAKEFPYYECKICSLIFLHPVPIDLARYYPPDYHFFPSSATELYTSAAVHEQYKVDILKRFAPTGRVLEIGPGVGGFALLAYREGYEVRVIEINERCCDFIHSVLGIQAKHALDEVEALSDEPEADVIALWQVLEHLPYPFRLIEVAVDRLKPGGTLIVAMPNPESFQMRVLGSKWVHLDAPRHVVLISRRLLLEETTRLGLTPLLVTTRDDGSLAWNRFGWEYSLPSVFSRSLSHNTAMRLGKRIGNWLSCIDDREGYGAAFVAVLKKPSV